MAEKCKKTTVKELLQMAEDGVFQGAVFDLDGTILDSMGMWYKIDVDFLKKRGIEMDESYNQDVKTMQLEEAAVYTINRYHLKEDPKEIVREWNEMSLYQYQKVLAPKPGAVDFLRELKQTGVKISLATVSRMFLVDAVFKAHDLYRYFDAVIDVDTVGRGKDVPDLYLSASEKIGKTPQQCLVFEDALQGIRTAKSAGFMTLGVFEELARKDIPLIKQYADLWLDNFL